MNPSRKPGQLPSTEDLQDMILRKIEEHKPIVVGGAAVLVVLVVGLILLISLRSQASERSWADLIGSSRSPLDDPVEKLRHVAEKGSGEAVPHALMNLATTYAREGKLDEALEVLDRFDRDYGDTFVARLPSPSRDISLPGWIRRWIENEKAWKDAHTVEPVEMDTSRVALVETTAGDFWMGFYPELSPTFVTNFVKRAKEGAFNGTQVYDVGRVAVRCGGPTTLDDDPLDDGDTSGDQTLRSEKGRYRIPVERGSVGAVPLPGGESAERFLVVVSSVAVQLEKQQTIFGKVLDDRAPGLTAIDDIANAKTYAKSEDPAMADNPDLAKIASHPVDPIRIERISIWSGGEIEDGHTWDTSTVTPPEEKAADEPPDEGAKDEGDAGESPVKDDETPKKTD